jgi:Tfp pilus assembly protein PilN
MYVRLNLATQPLVSHRRFLLGSLLLGILGSALFVYLGLHFYNLRKSDEDFRSRLGKIQHDMDRYEGQRADLERFFAKAENRDLQERAKFIGNVIEARSFNWTKMFMELEHTLPAGVHILRVEPKLEAGTVSVKFSIGGTTPDAKVALLKAFEDSKSFTHVELNSTGVIQQTGAAAADVFVLDFSAIYTGI